MFGLRYSDHIDCDTSSDEEHEDGTFQSVQDDFENEMKQEMESHAANLTTSSGAADGGNKLDQNDELLYDPEADDEDEKWVENKRKEYMGIPVPVESKPSASSIKCPESDAVLNCPGCMAVLCLDCQRHEVFKTQYRAMFVVNCIIDWSEKLTDEKLDRRKKAGKVDKSLPSEPGSYFDVRCSVCNTKVAVYDKDEVFHFFNVLSSYS